MPGIKDDTADGDDLNYNHGEFSGWPYLHLEFLECIKNPDLKLTCSFLIFVLNFVIHFTDPISTKPSLLFRGRKESLFKYNHGWAVATQPGIMFSMRSGLSLSSFYRSQLCLIPHISWSWELLCWLSLCLTQLQVPHYKEDIAG